MSKPIDFSKFRTSLTKAIPTISEGFHDPSTWISTGNYCLNYLISGDFNKGVPLGKVTCFAGASSAGKSYVVSGSMVKQAQQQGIQVVILDSENALDKKWLEDIGVDTSPDKLLKCSVSKIDDVGKIIHDMVSGYKSEYDSVDPAERPKLLFVIDSLGMLMAPSEEAQYAKGDMKGDMGRKPKMLMQLVRNIINSIAPYDIGIVATNHTYASQDMFDPDDKISGGSGFVYASSIVVAMKPKKLKEDADGNKISDIRGIKSSCKIVKSRYAKPFETVDVYIPYDTGMDLYSGLFDLFEKKQLLVKQGNRYKYKRANGEEMIEFRKNWTPEMFDIVMQEVMESEQEMPRGVGLDIDGEEEDNDE